MSLLAYACDDLLILYWERQEKMTPGLSIQVDEIELQKPILGAEWAEAPHYLLVAYCKGIARRNNPNIRILDALGQVQAETSAPKLSPIPSDWIADSSLPTRIRIEKLFLSRVPVSFPKLKTATLNRLAEGLADPQVLIQAAPKSRCYIRLPWLPTEEPVLLPISLRLAGTSTPLDSTQALIEGSFLHVLVTSPPEGWNKKVTYLIEADTIRTAAFKIREPKTRTPVETVPQWIETLLAKASGNSQALKAYCLLQLGTAAQARSRLAGQITGLRSGIITGTAWNPDHPDQIITLELRVDDEPLTILEANLPNPDQRTGNMPVNCSFNQVLDVARLGDQAHTLQIRDHATGTTLTGSPLFWGPGHFDGELALDAEGKLTGWVEERCHSRHPLQVRLRIDGEEHAQTRTHDLPTETRQTFSLVLPEFVFDTRLHRLVVEVRRADTGHEWVTLPQGIGVKTTYQGHIDFLNPHRVGGWIINRTAPKRPVPLDLHINGNVVASQPARLIRPDVSDRSNRCGFEFELPEDDKLSNTQTLKLHLAGTGIEVLGPPILATPYDVALHSLTVAAAALNHQPTTEDSGYGPETTHWARTQVITKVLQALRQAKTLPARITLDFSPLLRMPAHAEPDPLVDVIVPVYGGGETTLHCLHSVLAAKTETRFELIVIDDASEDTEMLTALRDLARNERLTLLENSHNRGFVGTVNRGMQLHTGRDVVLLNSDTQVADGWLDRLQAAACREANTGTVTPLSNNATILSIPQPDQENHLPEGYDIARLDALCAETNSTITVDIPTAVGFCMYIKRRVLDEVGYFDEALWEKGYGEENDFCLKASSLGWRHLAATDIFVWHEGGASFGDSKALRIQKNLDKLNQIYPDYSQTIQRFQAQDPLAPYRNRIIRTLLKQQADRYILFVIHGLGGGTHVAADILAERLHTEGHGVLELMSLSPGHWQMQAQGLPYTLNYSTHDRFERLVDDLQALGVWHIHYHQTMQFPKAIWTLPDRLGIPYDISLHDYLPICPRITLMDESGAYCEDAQYTPDTCNRCLNMNGFAEDDDTQRILRQKFSEFGGDTRTWRQHYANILQRARRVIAPSQTVVDIFEPHFGLSNIHHIPHLETPKPERFKVSAIHLHHIAVIGAIGYHKGYEKLLQCAKHACKQGLPLHFTVIGYTRDDASLLQYPNVSITGPYEATQLSQLIAQSHAGVALFLSPWPETYCFTLSEAWKLGLYPVALDIGAVGERIRASQSGLLLPLHTPAKTINQTLMALFESPLPTVQNPVNPNTHSVTQAYYGWKESP